MSGQSSPLIPTFEGHVSSTLDALVLFEACLSGDLNHVPRRPHDRERQHLIKSGNIFIYEEHASGIKRWTDGVSWSPSRILGNFLIYRELEKPFPPGEKKRALKKKKCSSGAITKPEMAARPDISGLSLTSMDTSAGKDAERALIGSLVDSYPFKPNGLIKKTISITHQGVPHHMVSYYNVSDVVSGRLSSPCRHPATHSIIPRPELIMSQSFRAPIDEVEYGLDDRGGLHGLYAAVANPHNFGNGQGALFHRAMTLPSFTPLTVPPSFGSSTTYGYNPQSHYASSMASSLPANMSQALSSAMPPPHLHQSSSSLQSSVSNPMPSSSSQLSYATHQQGNYALDAQRSSRFGSDSNLLHELPRNMPTHNSSRRSSTFEVSQASDLSPTTLGPMTDGRQSSTGSAYMKQSSCYFPTHHASLTPPENASFSHQRTIKAETELPSVEDVPQQYALDENNSAWSFDGIASSHAQHFFANPAGGNITNWHR
ncbi:hypothetical protein E4U41_003922 [Claviceps citrina]|nr:hypothetical protein E4U41_003922 [Claviceps citrina]